MPKMTDINLSEVSLVDWPAHMHNGFAIIKSADPDKDRALLGAFRKETMPDVNLTEVLKGLSADDIRKALSDEQLEGLMPPEAIVTKAEAEPEDILKGLPDAVREMIEKNNKDLTDALESIAKAEEQAEIEKAARLDGEAVAVSKAAYTNLGFEHEKVAPALRKFALADAEGAEVITEMLKAVNAQADGAIFKELGTTQGSLTNTSAEQITALAKAKATETGISFSKAYETVVNDPANKSLVDAHFKGNE